MRQQNQETILELESSLNPHDLHNSCGILNLRFDARLRAMTLRICLVTFVLMGSDVGACACQDEGGDVGDEVAFKIYRPSDHEVFPGGTRAVSIIGTKPLGAAGLLRIQDPLGNLVEIHYPAIRTFFNAILDHDGVHLPPGEWEATLCDGLEPLRAQDHVHFVIEDGDPPQAFPTIDIPRQGEIFAGNIPFIDFIGVASPASTTWLRIYRVSTQELVLEVEVEGTIGFVWGYVTTFDHGPGEYLAGVSPTSSDVSDYLSDSTTFKILERGEDDWPFLQPFKFLW